MNKVIYLIIHSRYKKIEFVSDRFCENGVMTILIKENWENMLNKLVWVLRNGLNPYTKF